MIPRCVLHALHQSPAVERGEHFTLFLQGEKPLGLWMVESGRLLVSRISGQGRSVVLDMLEAGDLAGLAATVGDQPHETSAETAEPCRLRLLPRSDFLRILQTDVESSIAIARLLATELAASHRWIGDTMLLSSNSARLATLLLHSSQSDIAALTHDALANRIGVSRESVTRLVNSFRARGALAPERGPLMVRSRSILERLAAA